MLSDLLTMEMPPMYRYAIQERIREFDEEVRGNMIPVDD